MAVGDYRELVRAPSKTTRELRDILLEVLPRYREVFSADVMADLLTGMGDMIGEHGWVPARTGPGREWVQTASLVRGALDAGADPYEIREFLYTFAIVHLYVLTEKIDERSIQLIEVITPDELLEERFRVGYGEDIVDHPDFDAD